MNALKERLARWSAFAGGAFFALAVPSGAEAVGLGADSSEAFMITAGPFERVIAELMGPTGRLLAAALFIVGGLVWGFTRHQKGAKRIGQAMIMVAIIVSSMSITAAMGFDSATM